MRRKARNLPHITSSAYVSRFISLAKYYPEGRLRCQTAGGKWPRPSKKRQKLAHQGLEQREPKVSISPVWITEAEWFHFWISTMPLPRRRMKSRGLSKDSAQPLYSPPAPIIGEVWT
jgi:hypothetical protein